MGWGAEVNGLLYPETHVHGGGDMGPAPMAKQRRSVSLLFDPSANFGALLVNVPDSHVGLNRASVKE